METPDPEVVVQHAQAVRDSSFAQIAGVLGAIAPVLRDNDPRLDGRAEAFKSLMDRLQAIRRGPIAFGRSVEDDPDPAGGRRAAQLLRPDAPQFGKNLGKPTRLGRMRERDDDQSVVEVARRQLALQIKIEAPELVEQRLAGPRRVDPGPTVAADGGFQVGWLGDALEQWQALRGFLAVHAPE